VAFAPKPANADWGVVDDGGSGGQPSGGCGERRQRRGLRLQLRSRARPMYALNAKTGVVLWSYDSGGAGNAGPSIADGMVYWGSGTFTGFGPKKVFAFGLN